HASMSTRWIAPGSVASSSVALISATWRFSEREIVSNDQSAVASHLYIALEGISALDHGRLEGGPAIVRVIRAAAAMSDHLWDRHREAFGAASPRTVERTTSLTGTVARRCVARGCSVRRCIAFTTALANSATGWLNVE